MNKEDRNTFRKEMLGRLEEQWAKNNRPEDDLFYYHPSEDKIVLSHALFWVMTQNIKGKVGKEKYDKETLRIKKKYQIIYPLVIFIISVIAFIFAFFNTDTVGSFLSFGIGFVVNVVYNWYSRVKVLTDKIKDRIAKRESVISQAVMERMNKEIGNKLENM